MKRIITASIFLISFCYLSANDTLIYDQTVTLDTIFSSYDNVEVVAHNSITFSSGFEYSSNGNGIFTANADPWSVSEPPGSGSYGTSIDSTGVLNGNYVVGTINGLAGVSPSGAASYSIPLELPAGNKGMVPDLRISYNSQGGNGMMGRGWNLSDISSITATGKVKYYDGESTVISDEDSLCRLIWDGQRLFGSNGKGLEADTFKTEIKSNSRIIKNGSSGSEWFEIRTQDGKTLEYGHTTNSKMMLDNETEWKWMLNKIKDRNGNEINYTYQTDAATHNILLSTIKYGGASYTLNEITFHYSDRSDISYAYVNNDLIVNNKILDSISIKSNSEFFGGYGLHYVTISYETLLTEIIQYDKDNHQYNPTSITWQAPIFNINSSPTSQTINSGTNTYHLSGDFTGDGIFDLVAVKLDFSNDECKYYLYEGSSTGLPSTPDDSCDLPRSYLYQHWDYFKDYIYQTPPGGCGYSNSPPVPTDFSPEDISYVFSGDFDGDGVEELFIKVLEWEELGPFLPDDLNNGFDAGFLSDFGGFLSYYNICQLIQSFTEPEHMILNYGIGHFINLDESIGSNNRQHSFRLGSSMSYKKQYSQFPDMDGRGYNSFPDNNSIMYYDPVNDTATVFCSLIGDEQRWGEFNGDGIPDYIDPANSIFKTCIYDKTTNSFDTSSVSGYFLGTIDLNGDGSSAWIALKEEEFDYFTYEALWDKICDTCNIYPAYSDWDFFLDTCGITEYEIYVHQNCDDIEDVSCREAFLETGDTLLWSIGHKLILTHYEDNGPEIDFGYFEGTHSPPNDPLFTHAIAADLTADGHNELLLFDNSKLVKIYHSFTPSYNNGNISYSYSTLDYNQPLGYDIEFGDFTGNGINEIVSPVSNKKICFVSSGKPGKLVSKITNGLGIESRFSYKPLTDASVYTKETDVNFPVIDYNAPMYVVSSISSDNGVADSSFVAYEYEGAKVHLQGKGFLGFMKTTAENSLLNSLNISLNDYDRNCFYTYPVSSLLKSGTISVQQTTSNISIDLESDKRIKIETDTAIVHDYLKGTTTTSAFDYNNDGLVSEKVTNIDELATITKRYYYTDAGWDINYLPEYISTTYEREDSISEDSIFMAYSSLGNLVMKKEFCGTDRELITRYGSIDSYGNPRKITKIGKIGPSITNDSIETDLSYSSCGRFVISKEGPLNNNIYYEYDLSTGNPESRTSVNDLATSFEYGPFNRMKKTVHPDNMEEVSVILWVNSAEDDDDPDGSLYYNWSALSGSPPILTYYDAVGRELRTVSTGFNSETIYTDTRYDSKGRVINRSLPYSTGNGLWDSIYYDDYGRVIREVSANGVETEYDYSVPLETTITVSKEETSQETRTETNALGEVIESEDNDGNIVYNSYYPDGKLKESYTSAGPSMKTKFTYDAQGNRTTIYDPDADTVRSLYDAFGLLLQQVDAKGDTTSFEYDDLGRIIKSTDNRGEIHYNYVSDTTDAAFGLADSVYNDDGSMYKSFHYDDTYGRLISTTDYYLSKTYTNSYTYDWFGRPMTRTYPSGYELQYAYTDNGYAEKITGDGLTLWKCNDMNVLGQITSYSQDSYTTTRSYDSYGELSRIETGTGTVFDMRYTFDDAGNLASREDYLTSQKEVFDYDDLNRLTGIDYYFNSNHQSSGDLDIAYNNCGNITSKTDVASTINYGVNAGPHALTSIESPVSGYKPPPQLITYTSFNKVSTIQDTIGQDTILTLTFMYGLNNQRVKTVKTLNSTVKQVKYFNGDYEEDCTTPGTKKFHYIYSPTGLIGIFVKEGLADTLYHVLSDHLGSLNGVINAETDDVTYYSFNAWGTPRDPDDWTSEFDGELFVERGYAWHEHLPEFNLINMNGRVYDPVLGRFLSPDPYVQLPGYANGFNRYAYALNNPLRFVDPSGYKYGPSDYEREIINGEHTYYNGEMAWKLGGNRTPFANAFEWGRTVGGWSYNWATGQYDNKFSGASMSAYNFSNSILPAYQHPDHTAYGTAAANALYSMFGYHTQKLGNPDALGSQYYLRTDPSGAMTTFVSPFWRETGTYYNELYFYSGLVAFEPEIALESLNTPNLSSGAFHALIKNGPGSALNAINKITGGISIVTPSMSWGLSQSKIGSNIAYSIAYSRALSAVASNLKNIGYIATGASIGIEWYYTAQGYQHWSESTLNTAVTGTSLIIGGWAGIIFYSNYKLGMSYMKMITEHPQWAPSFDYRGFMH